MNKDILAGDSARTAIERGINIVATTVACTLGPRGRNVIIQTPSGPIITKDGVTVAKAIELKDKFHNVGAKLVQVSYLCGLNLRF